MQLLPIRHLDDGAPEPIAYLVDVFSKNIHIEHAWREHPNR